MGRYYYDLHVHSCLSPCGDDDNTPNNIAGMASLSELDIVALTDHNSCKNCPAFFDAAAKYGIIPIAGMELTTSEDIHVVCLFETLDEALCFNEYVDGNRLKIKNRAEFFGNQRILDENDAFVSEEPYLLSSATYISIEEVRDVVASFNGVCYPAHIDRDANGIIAVLGTLPKELDFNYFGLHDGTKIPYNAEKYGIDENRFLVSSDAHYLADIRDKSFYLELDCEGNDPTTVRRALFKLLRS